MVEPTKPPCDWEIYKADFRTLYLEKSWSLKDIMSHMEATHNFKASEKQYKKRFNDWEFRKNLTTKDWAFVQENLRKRRLEGKDSDVYFDGRLVPTKRVKREVSRRFDKESGLPDAAGIGASSSVSNRISIVTPPPFVEPSSTQNPYNSLVTLDSSIYFDDSLFHDDPSHQQIPGPQIPSCNSMILVEGSNCFNIDFNMAALAEGDPVVTSQSANLHSQPDSAFEWLMLEEEFNFQGGLDSIEATLAGNGYSTWLQNIPWFRFQDIVEIHGSLTMNTGFEQLLNLQFLPAVIPLNSLSYYQDTLSVQERHIVLTRLLPTSAGGACANPAHFKSNLQVSMPERYQGELARKLQELFDPSNNRSLCQLFQLALYFSSNNILSETQTDNFLEWTIQQKHDGLLMSFLEIKSLSIRAFKTRVLESTIRIGNARILQQLINSGTDMGSFVQAKGSRLPRRVISRNHVDIAKILLQHGANVNAPFNESGSETPLHLASYQDHVEMVELLLEAGANVNAEDDTHKFEPFPLSRALCMRNTNVVRILVEAGADVDECEVLGDPALLWSRFECDDTYQILLSASRKSSLSLSVHGVIDAAYKGAEALSKYFDGSEETNRETKMQFLGDALIAAANKDKLQISKLLVGAGANVSTPQVLMAAVCPDEACVLEFLLERHIDVENCGGRALQLAASLSNINAIQLLINHKADINALTDMRGKTTLQHIVRHDDLELTKYLVAAGAEINAPASHIDGYTALQAAAKWGSIDLVIYLLEEGADVNAPGSLVGGMTALQAAVERREDETRRQIVHLLVEYGADVNAPKKLRVEKTVLHSLIRCNDIELVQLVLEKGADINRVTSGGEGRSPIQAAAEKGNLEIVKLLFDKGVDINAPAGLSFGRTALQAAVSSGQPNLELINFLLENDAKVNAPAGLRGGLTTLQGAAICGHVNVALMLLERGADVNAPAAPVEGRTALDGAAEHGRLDMVQVLLNAGAKGDTSGNKRYGRAIELAKGNGHFAIAQLLEAS